MQTILPDAPAPGQSIGPPFITLVDIDGLAVPTAEKDIPEVREEPCAAHGWPRWTDLMIVADGPKDMDVQGGVDALAEAFYDHLERLECPEPDGFAAALRDLERAHPVPAVLPDSFPEILPPGSDAPDDHPSRSRHFAGMLARGIVPPVSGGSDEAGPFEPSEADWADYRQWSEGLERRRSLADIGRHAPAALARINLALYGSAEPAHA